MMEAFEKTPVENQTIPFQFRSDEQAIVGNASPALQELTGKDFSVTRQNLDQLLQLDHHGSDLLRQCSSTGQPISFRAPVRTRGTGLFPVYWTVIPGGEGLNWYGSPAVDRDRTEGRLNELERIVSSFHDIVFELDNESRFLNFWVKDPSSLFIPPHLFLGEPLKDVLTEYYGPLGRQMLEAYHQAYRTIKALDFEYRLPGFENIFSCRFQPILDIGEQMVGMLLIITDITAQRQLENDLRISEEKYRDLFENANDIIYIIDNESRITSMNRTAERLLEYTEAEMLGQSSHVFFAPEKLKDAIELGEQKRQGVTGATRYESEFVSRLGKRIWVEVSSRLIYKEGQPIGIHVTARDIGAQKQSEMELAKSEAKFRFLSEYARDMICLHRPNGDYLYVSPSCRQMIGYEPDELNDRSPYDFFHPDDVEAVLRDAHTRNVMGLDSSNVQYRFRHKDGHYVWLESVSKPIVEDGEVIYIQTNTRDINDRKLAEQQLVEKDRLSSALAQASRELLVGNTLDEVLAKSMPILGSAAQSECLFVIRYSESGPELFHIWCLTSPCSVMDKKHLFRGMGLLLPIGEDCRAGNTTEFQLASESDPAKRDWMEKLGYKSLLITTIVTADFCWGVLGCGQKSVPRNFSVTVTDTLTTFASSVSSVIVKNRSLLQLSRSEEKFRALFLNSLDIVFLAEENGKLIYVTPSLKKILGYEEMELLQVNCAEIIHPDERKTFEDSLMNLVKGTDPNLLLQLRVRHQNGNWLWMELKAENKLDDPNINGVILSLRDISEYVEIEKTLKQYSDRITNMLHSVTDGFIALDRDFRLTMFNKMADELLGDKIHLALGNRIHDLADQVESPVVIKSLKLAERENRTIRYEEYVSSLKRWFDVSIFPYTDGFFIYFKDISIRKTQEYLLQLEKEVLEMHAGSEHSLVNITDHLLTGLERISHEFRTAVFLVKSNNREGRLLSAPGMPEAYRHAMETISLDPGMTICGKAIAQRQQVVIKDLAGSDLAMQTLLNAEMLGIKAAWSTPIISSANEILGTCVVHFDSKRSPTEQEADMFSRAIHILTIIIENRQAAEKLRISNERYILATRASNEAIWDWDAEQETSYWGEGFNTLFGYPSMAYPGSSLNWESKIHPDDRDRVLHNMNEVLNGRKNQMFVDEYRFLKADGTYALVVDKAFCLYDDKGKVIRMVGSCEDITERKMLEEKLIQQEIAKQQQIAQAVVDVQENERAEIGKELHDNVNQLLTTAKLFLEVASNDTSMAPDMIRRSSDTIMNAINEIRKISRSLMPASVSDLGLISSVNDLVQNISITKQLEVDFRYDANLEKLLSSKQKLMLFRIIQEQVNNVLKHANAGKLRILIRYTKSSTRLEIADDGIGFEMNQVKLKNGLGLSNIMSRAAIFNATVKVDTAPGKGCRLIINLPNPSNKQEA